MGRVDDVIIIRGVNIFPSVVENIVRGVPQVGEFAMDVHRRHELDDMELRIEVVDGDPEAVVAEVSREIRNALGLRVMVAAVPFGSLPRFDLKARRVTDHRPRG